MDSFDCFRARKLVCDLIEKNMFSSAISIAEKLAYQPHSSLVEYHLYARCLLLSGEPRRCLAVIEQKGLLSANVLKRVVFLLDDISRLHSERIESPATATLEELGVIILAANCLLSIEEYEDCTVLLEPFIAVLANANAINSIVQNARGKFSGSDDEKVNVFASIFCLAGKCLDALENRTKALLSFKFALMIDLACLEAMEYISSGGLMTKTEIKEFVDLICNDKGTSRPWLIPMVITSLCDCGRDRAAIALSTCSLRSANDISGEMVSKSPTELQNDAEQCYEACKYEEAYMLARYAYTKDPFHSKILIIYIAAMKELNLKNELYYLGHELVNSYPKKAVSWYCVGCYYLICSKFDISRRYLLKATKLDKKFSMAWVILGHVLCCLEESEQSISCYRTAIRLLPGDHRPLFFMAKEFIRTNHLSLALHLLNGALDVVPDDVQVTNEIAIVYLKLGKLEDAVVHLGRAIKMVNDSATINGNKNRYHDVSHLFELFNNYATLLRKVGEYDAAIFWYTRCLALNPIDSNILASIGFVNHLLQRFEEAITFYHKSLALDPSFTFCGEMLTKAMIDSALQESSNLCTGFH